MTLSELSTCRPRDPGMGYQPVLGVAAAPDTWARVPSDYPAYFVRALLGARVICSFRPGVH